MLVHFCVSNSNLLRKNQFCFDIFDQNMFFFRTATLESMIVYFKLGEGKEKIFSKEMLFSHVIFKSIYKLISALLLCYRT